METGNPTSFIAMKRSSSSESSETVTLLNPASASASAFRASSAPFVVSVRSSMPSMPAIISTRSSMSARSSGSPPVSRTFSTPRRVATPTTRAISSKVRRRSRARNS